jgi:hypothetical protein
VLLETIGHSRAASALTRRFYDARKGSKARLLLLRGRIMNQNGQEPDNAPRHSGGKPLTAAAQRALAEAEARRQHVVPSEPQKEINGRNGPEPVRYGDWEHKGLASDF